jgi:hypothetical protein
MKRKDKQRGTLRSRSALGDRDVDDGGRESFGGFNPVAYAEHKRLNPR